MVRQNATACPKQQRAGAVAIGKARGCFVDVQHMRVAGPGVCVGWNGVNCYTEMTFEATCTRPKRDRIGKPCDLQRRSVARE